MFDERENLEMLLDFMKKRDNNTSTTTRREMNGFRESRSQLIVGFLLRRLLYLVS